MTATGRPPRPEHLPHILFLKPLRHGRSERAQLGRNPLVLLHRPPRLAARLLVWRGTQGAVRRFSGGGQARDAGRTRRTLPLHTVMIGPFGPAFGIANALQAIRQRARRALYPDHGKIRSVPVLTGSACVNAWTESLPWSKSMQLRDRAERLEATLRPAHAERSGDIRLVSRGTHAKVLAAIRDLVVTTPDGRPLFRLAKLDIRQGDRLVLLGRNGVGKSQLIRLVRRAIAEPVPGVQVSPSLAVGYVDQGMAHLPDSQTPHRFIAVRPGIGDGRATGLLAGAGFSVEAQARPIGRLSPGQKARLGLLALRVAEPNFYLLDEPTNHIDIPGQEQLEVELLAQGATCILVSHDRSFVGAIATRFLLIERGQAREVSNSWNSGGP